MKRKLVLKFTPNKSTASEESSTAIKDDRVEASNGLDFRCKATIIRIIPKVKIDPDAKISTSAGGDDIPSQKRKPIKLKLKNFNAKNNDNSTQVDSSQITATSRDAPQKHKFRISMMTPRNAEKNPEPLIPFSSCMTSASGSKSEAQLSWLLSEGCRYIPQLGDQVVYLRQGHQEYIESGVSSERGPWMLFGENIRDVEICSVDDVHYAALPGSGEICCKAKLRFVDPVSSVCGKTFKMTLPELINFPDFLLERTRYEASLERNWSSGDKCSVWWQDEEGGGNWWQGRIVSVSDKSVDFPGSPWERFLVTYPGDDVEPCRHCPWELHDKDGEWEQPGLDPEDKELLL